MPTPDEPRFPPAWKARLEDLLLYLYGSFLSPRERQVFSRRIFGMSGAMIARELYISVDAVSTHDRGLMAKFDLASVRELSMVFLLALLRKQFDST